MKVRLQMMAFITLASSSSLAMDFFKPNQNFIKNNNKTKTAVDDRQVPPCLNKAEQEAQNFFYCPDPSDMYKIDGKWNAPPDWFSYERSFSSTVNRFLGASWNGVNIGKIVCLYQGPSSTFPVQITSSKSVFKPIRAKWELQPTSDGSFICKSNNGDVCDCGFSLYTTQIKSPKDVSKSFMQIEKKNPAPYTSPFYGY